MQRLKAARTHQHLMITGLRGVGKTVLLNTFKSMAMQRLWGALCGHP